MNRTRGKRRPARPTALSRPRRAFRAWLLVGLCFLAEPFAMPQARAQIPPPPKPVPFKRGDADGNGCVNIYDVIFILSYLFTGGRYPECLKAADVNDDGRVDLPDAVDLLSHVDGPPGAAFMVPAPGPVACGFDPTPDDLGCKRYFSYACDATLLTCLVAKASLPVLGGMDAHFRFPFEIDGLGLARPDLSGPIAVQWGDPHIDEATLLASVDAEITEMTLAGADPVLGRVLVGLNPAQKALGSLRQTVPGPVFPSQSFLDDSSEAHFDVFLKVELLDLHRTLYSCAAMGLGSERATAGEVPPLGMSFRFEASSSSPVLLYETPCGSGPPPSPVGAIHDPTLQLSSDGSCSCFPSAGEDVLAVTLPVSLALPGVEAKCALSGPLVLRHFEPSRNAAGGCCLHAQVVRMELAATCGDYAVTARLSPEQVSTIDFCRKESGACFPAEGISIIYLDVEVPVKGVATLFKACKPAILHCTIGEFPPLGCAFTALDAPLELYQVSREEPFPCLAAERPQPSGKVLGLSLLPESTLPACCPELGPGVETLAATLTFDSNVANIGRCQSELEGRIVVRRGQPYRDPLTHFCRSDTEVLELDVRGSDSVCGRIHVGLDPRTPTWGMIGSQSTDLCLPARSCFDAFLRVTLEDHGLVLVSCDAAGICARMDRAELAGPTYKLGLTPVGGIPLYQEDVNPGPCRVAPRARSRGSLLALTEAMAPACACFPPAGTDDFTARLQGSFTAPGLGGGGDLVCSFTAEGPIRVKREDAVVDPATGQCCVQAEILSMDLRATSSCGPIRIQCPSDPSRRSLGSFCEAQPSSCFPADASFDAFLSIDVGQQTVRLETCAPVRLKAVLPSYPADGARFDLDLRGAPLWKLGQCASLPGAGLPAAGTLTAAELFPFGSGPKIDPVVPGDLTSDAKLDISDAVALLGFLFLGSPASLPCGDGTLKDAGNVMLIDLNGDHRVDLSDATYLLSFLFLGSAAPVLGKDPVEIPGCGKAGSGR